MPNSNQSFCVYLLHLWIANREEEVGKILLREPKKFQGKKFMKTFDKVFEKTGKTLLQIIEESEMENISHDMQRNLLKCRTIYSDVAAKSERQLEYEMAKEENSLMMEKLMDYQEKRRQVLKSR